MHAWATSFVTVARECRLVLQFKKRSCIVNGAVIERQVHDTFYESTRLVKTDRRCVSQQTATIEFYFKYKYIATAPPGHIRSVVGPSISAWHAIPCQNLCVTLGSRNTVVEREPWQQCIYISKGLTDGSKNPTVCRRQGRKVTCLSSLGQTRN